VRQATLNHASRILFTQGDMDTYPLLYLQTVEGLRQDVIVVNVSLLNENSYVNELNLDRNNVPFELVNKDKLS
jgi:hypothetical protein